MFKLTSLLFQISPRSLLIAALSLHLFIAIGTYIMARARVLPALKRDGVVQPVTPDSLDHICFSEGLAQMLRAGDLRSWIDSSMPLNTKIYSLSFVVLSPLLGMSVLAGEPINLMVYAAILTLVFAIGKTVFSHEVGLVSSTIVAIWPSFLLHTTQLLKDQFFIAALLMIVLIMVSWLTKPKPSIVLTSLLAITGAVSAYTIARTRTPYWALLIVVFILIGFALLLIRQLLQRQLLLGYMVTAVPIIVVLIATYLATPTISMQVVPSPNNPSSAPRSTSAPPEDPLRMTLKRRLDLLAVKIWQIRNDYEMAEGGAGIIDNGLVFADVKQLLRYVPRATLIGFFAPFPNQWLAEGRQSGRIGRLIASGEMLLVYIALVFAILALWRGRKSLATWLLVLISLTGVTAVALIVPNLGALFRMRYGFLIVIVPLAGSELVRLIKSRRTTDSPIGQPEVCGC